MLRSSIKKLFPLPAIIFSGFLDYTPRLIQATALPHLAEKKSAIQGMNELYQTASKEGKDPASSGKFVAIHKRCIEIEKQLGPQWEKLDERKNYSLFSGYYLNQCIFPINSFCMQVHHSTFSASGQL